MTLSQLPDNPEDTPLAWSEKPTPPLPPTPQQDPARRRLGTSSEVITRLGKRVDPRHLKERRQGGKTVTYLDWACYVRHLNHRAPGWTFVIHEVSTVGDFVFARGDLTIPTDDGPLVFTGVSSERIDSPNGVPVETVCSRALARAAALSSLSLELWEGT